MVGKTVCYTHHVGTNQNTYMRLFLYRLLDLHTIKSYMYTDSTIFDEKKILFQIFIELRKNGYKFAVLHQIISCISYVHIDWSFYVMIYAVNLVCVFLYNTYQGVRGNGVHQLKLSLTTKIFVFMQITKYPMLVTVTLDITVLQ